MSINLHVVYAWLSCVLSFDVSNNVKGLLCRLATRFVSNQNWQYITMNVFLPSVFYGPSSPAILCAKISQISSSEKFYIICGGLDVPTLNCNILSRRRAPCLLCEECHALVDWNTRYWKLRNIKWKECFNATDNNLGDPAVLLVVITTHRK